jgi:hypothetical protein
VVRDEGRWPSKKLPYAFVLWAFRLIDRIRDLAFPKGFGLVDDEAASSRSKSAIVAFMFLNFVCQR